MSKPKYLFLDDENDETVDAVRDGLNDQGLIDVTIQQPLEFKSQKKELVEKLMEYDGLILDFRLDQNMKLDVSYNAPTIAQELRTSVTNPEVNLMACPIILCSTDERISATYNADKTSHDLFDYKFLKGSEPYYLKISKKLASLAKGYKWLRESERTIYQVLDRENISDIDTRITERFLDIEEPKITYDYARFIVKDIFHHPGPLIKERVLAARLGVDIEASDDAWVKIRREVYSEFKYSGLFSDGWDRWWSDKIINQFKKVSGGNRLATMNAQDRVKILVENYGVDGLIPASAIPYANSSSFWTICEDSKKPLDPLEGFRVFESTDLKAWQEPKYVSFNAVAGEGISKEKGLRPHPSENKRIQLMKESLSKNED